MKLQVREMLKSTRVWTAWEDCEGTDGLTLGECDELLAEWAKTDQEIEWLKIEYRIVADNA